MEHVTNDFSRMPNNHTPTANDKRLREAFDEGHDGDIPSNTDVVDILSFPNTKHAPQEYRKSYTHDGVLPARVLHMKNHASVDDTGSTAADVESVKSFNGSSASLGNEEKDPEKAIVVEEVDKDPNVVDWDGPDDPANPMNWPMKRKWLSVFVIAAVTFITPLSSTIFAPGVPLLMDEFHSSNTEVEAFVVSVFILGYVFGPLVVAPLSELYGRVPIFQISNVLFFIFTIACAVSTNLPMFIVWRFLCGFFGSTPLTVGGGVIADIMPQEKRGGAMSIWALGPILAPVIGPVAGGYLAETVGWRWIFWVVVIVAGLLTVMSMILMRETYAPALLKAKTKRLRKETGNMELQSKLDNGQKPGELFKKAIVRPAKMLCTSPIVFSLSFLMSLAYGYLYLLFTSFTFIFQVQYGFTSGQAGLTYLGIGIGSMAGLIATGLSSDKYVKKKSAQGVMKPEYRLPPLVPGAILMPIGLFWFGWSADKHTHWIVPIIGSMFVGMGLIATYMPISYYLVDAFPVYAASATAAATVLRSIFGALLPLAGQSLFNSLGLGWGASLLGFISLACVPVPLLLIKYGEYLRTNPKFQLDL